MTRIFHIDYETFSDRDLKKLGAFVYAESPNAEILIAAVAEERETGLYGPFLYVAPQYEDAGVRSDPRALELINVAFSDPEAELWAHNAQFESVLTKHCWPGPKPSLLQWRCTAALARKAGLEASLDAVCKKLQLRNQKGFLGYALIRKFCIPQKDGTRIMPADEPEKWRRFCDYCLDDVRAESEIYRVFKPIRLRGFELRSFQQDMIMNHRGIPVDMEALKKAAKLIQEIQKDTTEEFVKLTGLQPTQRDKVMQYLQKRGAKILNMRKRTLDELFQEDEEDEKDEFEIAPDAKAEIKRAVELYQILGYAAVKKVASMILLASPDNRVRGTLLWYGAGTGRSSGVKLQPQNFKKPQFKSTHEAYELIKMGTERWLLDSLWGNAYSAIASCIRHFFQGPLNDADYNAIEARIACWLADQEDVLEMFRQGAKLYEAMAARIFGIPASKIQNPSFERDTGKAAELGCQYQQGPAGFKKSQADKGLKISDEVAESAVKAYRDSHPKVKDIWRLLDNAAKAAIRSPGARFWAGTKLSFSCAKLAGLPYLIMHLPSGRSLYYPEPKIERMFAPKLGKDVEQVTYWGRLKGKTYGRVPIYGGAFLENACQAIGGDIMVNGLLNAEDAGFQPFLPVHDQALALAVHGPMDKYIEALTRLPAWAKGLPIKAEGKVTPYYQK